MLILVLGASGMLGREVVYQLEQDGIDYLAFDKKSLNIGNEMGLHQVFRKHKISFVINCAAYTNVNNAYTEKHLCELINVNLLQVLAEVVAQYNIPLVHFSTDYVFDGSKKIPYEENDRPCPINFYGKSKLAGENVIRNICSDYKIFRLQWLYGNSGINFLDKIAAKYKGEGQVHVVSDQWGCPCSTAFIARTLLIILKRWEMGESGIYHLTHNDYCTWFEFAQYFFGLFGKSQQVIPIKSNDLFTNNLYVRRPKNATLDNQKIISGFKLETLGSWQNDLENYISNRKDIIKIFTEERR